MACQVVKMLIFFYSYEADLLSWFVRALVSCTMKSVFFVLFLLRVQVTAMSTADDRFRKMIEHSQDWFWEFDEHANFTYVSPRIRDLLGYEADELLGLNAFDLMDTDEAKRVHEHFDPIAKRYLPFNNLININRHKDGHEVVIESSGTPIFDEEGQFRGYRGVDRDITARQKIEDELRESKEKLQNIFDTSSEWIWEIDLSGRHTYSNQSLLSILGYHPGEIVGKSYFDLLHEEDSRQVIRVLPELIAEKRGWDGWVLSWRHRDGSYRFLESNAQPIFNLAGEVVGFRGADRDITERKQAADALRKSQDILAQTQQLAQVGSWQLNVVTNHLVWSEETCRIFGVNPQTFVVTYEAFLDMVHPDDRAAVNSAYSASLRDRQNTYQLGHRIVRKDTGEIRYVYEKCRHDRDLNGVIIRSIGMVQDVTERKTNEVALLAATQAAEAANRSKGLFLAKVSHEIRTPMTSIIGFGELLEDTELTSEQQKYLAAINSSGRALSLLIDDVLDLSKVDAGELSIKRVDFKLHDFIRKSIGLLEQQAAAKNLAFAVKIDMEVPELLFGDPLRMQQVLLNLVGNAVKFTEKGEISIETSLIEETGSRVLLDISVKDTGIGIPENLLGKIFEPFAQAPGVNSQNYGGAGLGLSISRSLAALMGGSLRVESRAGEGSVFHFFLPLLRKSGHPKEKGPAKREVQQRRCSALNVLLAEDNPVNTQFIRTILENLGHRVTHAGNGKIAIDLFREDCFDLVLMDIQMPVMDGVDALGILRNLESRSGRLLRIIALTAFALIGDREKYLEMGFDGYLSKPFTTRALVTEMERVLPCDDSLGEDV